MAAGAFTVYSNAALGMSKGSFNLSTDTYVMILVTNTYTPAANTDHLYSDVSANELTTSGGYTVGGDVLAGVTDTLTTATVTFTCTAPTWAAFTNTFRYAVIIRRAGGSLVAGDLLLCFCDCTGGGSITGGGGTLTITPNASGIFTITHSP